MEEKKTNTTNTVDLVPVNNKIHDNDLDVVVPEMNQLEVGDLTIDEDSYN